MRHKSHALRHAKRAQSSRVITYLLIAIFVIAIQLFGYYVLTTFREQVCKTEFAGFQIQLQDSSTLACR